MKKACLLAFCFFLSLAFVCGCTDSAEESSTPVSSAESSFVSESESSAVSSEGESSVVSVEDSSAEAFSALGSSAAESSEDSIEESFEESDTESSEESIEESSEEISEEPDESSESEQSVAESSEDSSEIEESSLEESSAEESSVEESSVEESSDATSEPSSGDRVTYEDTLVCGKDGNYTCGVPYGYTWNVDYVNGVIVGEDVTVCTTQAAYESCNPDWAITIYAEKQSDGRYMALRDAIAIPGSASAANLSVGGDRIAIVIHSAASKPGMGYDNWKGKVVAMATKAGDLFEIDGDFATVYAVIPENGEGGNGEMNGIGDAEFIPTGYLLYNGAAYAQARYSSEMGPLYADTYAKYAEAFPEVGIHVINHPLSAINITNPLVREMTNNQRTVLNLMEQCIYGDVNFVNLGAIFEEHRGEYLYFKSDYHWTQRGAYYAYVAFAESVGLAPTPLEAFEETVINDSFIGHTNDYAHDDRILSFFDTVYAYMPTKEHTYAVYFSDMSLYRVYQNCIQPSIDNYSCFLTGDQPFAVINVPENDQDKTVVVIKDSSANAFVPFLTEHYGNIVIIDPRHIHVDIREVVRTYGADDIIFFATASTSNGSAYRNYYEGLLSR